MWRQKLVELTVPSRGRGFYEVTGEVRRHIRLSGIEMGLCTLHLAHTSASLLIQENADPDVRHDLERFFARLAPDGAPQYEHRSEGPDDMPAHIRTALTAVNLSLPIARGEPVLGTWQGVYVWEHRIQPHRRRLVLHILGETPGGEPTASPAEW